jgi:hypothetical protein
MCGTAVVTLTSLPSADPVGLLVQAMDALAAQVPAQLPPAAALERTRVLLAQSERMKTLALQGLGDVESRDLYALEGAPTTSAWVRAQDVAGVDQREVAMARRLSTVPVVEGELLAGRLSSECGVKVTTAVAKARPFLDQLDGRIDGQPAEETLYGVLVDGVCSLLAEQTGGAPASDPEQGALRAELETIFDADLSQRARVEAALVVFAQRCKPGMLASGLALLLDTLLPNEHDKRAAKADDEAGCDLRRKSAGSGWTISGDLDDETGEMLDVVLRAQRDVDPENVTDTDAHRAAADDPDLTGLDPCYWPQARPRPRSLRERNHAALKAALRLLLGSGALGLRDKVAPHVSVVVENDFLHGVPGALPARTASGARWSRRQVRRLLSDSVFTRMVRDASHRIIEVSHTERTLKGFERRILHAQWGSTCAGATCCRGPATGDRLVPHHPELFSRTGTTSLHEAIPLCEQEHFQLHDGKLIKLKDGRWLGPDGWVGQRSA